MEVFLGYNIQPYIVFICIIFLVITLGVMFIAVLNFQIITLIQMWKFKKSRLSEIKQQLAILKSNLKAEKGLTQKAQHDLGLQVFSLNIEQQNVANMKGILINSALVKKLLISLIGVFITYFVNYFLRIS